MWWVRVSYPTSSWMNWKPGRPTASKDSWSVPRVFRMVTVVAPRSFSGSSHVSKIGTTAAFSCA